MHVWTLGFTIYIFARMYLIEWSLLIFECALMVLMFEIREIEKKTERNFREAFVHVLFFFYLNLDC